MALVLRTVKNDTLTFTELDGNFTYLSQSIGEAFSTYQVSSSSFATSASYSLTSSVSVSASFVLTASVSTSSSFSVSSSVSITSSFSESSSFSNTSSFVVSNPTGSRKVNASFGCFSSDMSNLSGSSGIRQLPPGYTTYFIFCNESFNGSAYLKIYPITSNGFTRLNPAYNSTITIINKQSGNRAWVLPSDNNVKIYKNSTSETLDSCSLAPNSYITLFLDDDSFIPTWNILVSSSLH